MKASELQIGDLIYVYGQDGNLSSEPHWYVREVTADWLVDMVRNEEIDRYIAESGITIPAGQLSIGDTKPITLTEEILNANFTLWHETEYRKEYEYNKEGDYVNVIIRPSHYLYVMVGNDQVNLHMDVHSVHELQHALRLCGLNELANNFMVSVTHPSPKSSSI